MGVRRRSFDINFDEFPAHKKMQEQLRQQIYDQLSALAAKKSKTVRSVGIMEKSHMLDSVIRRLQEIRMMDGNDETLVVSLYDDSDNTYKGFIIEYNDELNVVIFRPIQEWESDTRSGS